MGLSLKKLGKALDPTGDNFLGTGKIAGRVIGGVLSGGATELHRPDPFGTNRNTAFAKGIGGATTGAFTGAVTGFMIGGPYGAVAGGVIGAGAGAYAGVSGKTNNYTIVGTAKNVGIGVASGIVGGYGANAVGYFAGSGTSGGVAGGAGGTTAGTTASTTAAGGTAGTSATSTAVATTAKASTLSSVFGGAGKAFEALIPAAFISQLTKQGQALLPGTGGGSTGVTLNTAGPGIPVTAPSNGPSEYPGVPSELQTLSSGGIGDAAPGQPPMKPNYLLYGALALAAFFFLKKKRMF